VPILFILKLQDGINIEIFFLLCILNLYERLFFLIPVLNTLRTPYNIQSAQISRPMHCPVKDFEFIQLTLRLKMKIKDIYFDNILDSDWYLYGLHCVCCRIT